MQYPSPPARLACPVCRETPLQTTRLGTSRALELQHCPGCGGVWFDHGGVEQLRALATAQAHVELPVRGEGEVAKCRGCAAPIGRQLEACWQCGRANTLDCPVCVHPMSVEAHEGIALDVCRGCRGIWFDRDEMRVLWVTTFEASRERGGGGGDGRGGVWHEGTFYYSADALFDVLFFASVFPRSSSSTNDRFVGGVEMAAETVAAAPDIVHLAEGGVRAADALEGSGAEVLDAAGDILETLGDAAVNIFGALASILEGIDF